jgi:hypothetical protein
MTERNETAQPAPLGQVERGVGRPTPKRDELDVKLLLLEANIQSAMNMMLAARVATALQEWIAAPTPPSERQIRWRASYERERRRAEADFRAAFPNWKTPNVRANLPP